MNDLSVTPEDYNGFIDELKSAVVEIEWGATDYLIRGYHEIGKYLTNSSQRYESLKKVSRDAGIPQRTLERCSQFYRKFPDLSLLPYGKAISWHRIVNELLPEHKEKESVTYSVCEACGGKGKIKNEI